jgi:hypothetical protein
MAAILNKNPEQSVGSFKEDLSIAITFDIAEISPDSPFNHKSRSVSFSLLSGSIYKKAEPQR